MLEPRPVVDLRRRPDARLQVSRLAAARFWRDGLAATRGDDIAADAGVATRTLWRYFRSKEACAEPVLAHSGRRFVTALSAWPLDLSIEEFLDAAAPAAAAPASFSDDDVHAMRMIVLGFSEPALRSSWLMVCDAAERETVPLFARRLGLPPDSREAQQVTAAVSGAVRVLNDSLSVDFVEHEVATPASDVLRDLARAVRQASDGRLGPAVTADRASERGPEHGHDGS